MMLRQTKALVLSSVVAVIAALGICGTPNLAHAQAVTAAQAAPADVKDCTNGCDISTCKDGWCTVWHCDKNGCVQTGRYRYIGPLVQGNSSPLDDKTTAVHQYGKFAYVKVCSGALCRVYQLSTTKANSIGMTDNVQQMIRDYEASQGA